MTAETSPYTEATVEKGRFLWTATLCPRVGHRWMTPSAPTRYGVTRNQALRRIRRQARRLAARNSLRERVTL